MEGPVFAHLSSGRASELVDGARRQVLFCASGLQQSLAAALANAKRRLGRESVRVVLDVADSTARMGYGDFEAVSLLKEENVDVRVEPGLRACVLVCDDTGYVFFAPPMLVETQDDQHIGPNALVMHPAQVQMVVATMLPSPAASNDSTPPQVGKVALSAETMQQVKDSLDANPPQKFDLARKVNVFNAFIEFVELRLTGLHIARHTVQLPREMVLALRDDATARRLLTTFKLVSDESKVAKEAAQVDQRVRALREKYTRSLGENQGSVILRSKRQLFSDEVQTIRQAIERFQDKVLENLEKELADSRRKLVDGLLPAMKKAPPLALQAQVSGKPSVDVLRRYLDDELKRAFPSAKSLIGEMSLEWTPKGVTYETLSSPDFQERVRKAFPYEDWDKPFREFEAIPTSRNSRSLFE